MEFSENYIILSWVRGPDLRSELNNGHFIYDTFSYYSSDFRFKTLDFELGLGFGIKNLDLGLKIPDKSASIGFKFIGNSRNSITQI